MGNTVPVIDKFTFVVAPVLSTRWLHDGFLVRGGAYGFWRLFQTFAALKLGFATIAAGSGPFIGGELPTGLLVLNATLMRRFVADGWLTFVWALPVCGPENATIASRNRPRRKYKPGSLRLEFKADLQELDFRTK